MTAEARAEQERITAEARAEQERIAAEGRAEQERIAAEQERIAAEQERIAAEARVEHERIAAEQERIAAEQERIAAERARVAEERRQAEEAQARAVADRKRAVAERKAAEIAQARAEKERIAAERRAAERAQREAHVAERAAAELASQRAEQAEQEAIRSGPELPARFAAPPIAPHVSRADAPRVVSQIAAQGRNFGGAVKVAAIGALMVALVAGIAPRVPAIVDWGRTLIGQTPAADFGQTVAIDANTFHPDTRLTAGLPTTAKVTAGAVPKGSAALQVPLGITNEGASRWTIPLGAQLIAIDSLGLEHRIARGVTGVKGQRVLPVNLRIAPGGTATGSAVFAVPVGRTISEVRLDLSSVEDDYAVWEAK